MAIFRILEGKARPGAIERLSELLVRQEREIVGKAPASSSHSPFAAATPCSAVSSWRTAEDMQRYLDQPATNDFYAALPELLMGVPSVRTYEVIRPAGESSDAQQSQRH